MDARTDDPGDEPGASHDAPADLDVRSRPGDVLDGQARRHPPTRSGAGRRTRDGRPGWWPRGGDRSTGRWGVVLRTFREAREDDLTDWAAALTYYGVLALFPALIALVSLVGLVADPEQTTEALTETVAALGPETATDTFRGPIESITEDRRRAGVGLVAGLGLALWTASGWVGAFGRASAVVFETREGRPFWRLRPLQVVVTLAMVIAAALVALSLVLTGPVVDAVAEPLGLGEDARLLWDVLKWPVVLTVVVGMVVLVYRTMPNLRPRGWRWLLPGAFVAVGLWVVASALLALYVSRFGSYERTYGTLAGIVVFLLWLYLSNLALLVGAQVNAERERRLELKDGVPDADRELQRPPKEPPDRPETA